MLHPFFDNIRMSLLRNIRIPQNLGNKFAHAFATCTGPSRLGLEFEANVTLNHGQTKHRAMDEAFASFFF